MLVLPADSLQRQNIFPDNLPVFCRRRSPIFPDWPPRIPKPFFIRISVLRNDRRHSFRMSHCQPQAGRRAVIEHIDRIALQSQRLGESIDRGRQRVEGVGVFPFLGHLRKSEARQIRRDHPVTIGKAGNQLAPEPPLFGNSRGAETSAFALREHYRGLGYNPQPFEEPSGKGWYIAAAILLVLLGVGTVLAIGPANVKSLVAQHIPSSIFSSIYSSNPAPPPPENATDKTSPATTSAPSSSASVEDLPLGTAAERPIVNPGISDPPEPPQPAHPEPAHPVSGASVASSRSAAAAPVPAPTQPADTRAANKDSINDSGVSDSHVPDQVSDEDAAEITRRFQMEHSYSSAASVAPATGNFSSSPRTASAPSVAQDPARTVQNDRTFDAYPEPAPASAQPVASVPAPASSPANASSQVAPPPAGTVAVSSHFYALRGEDPQTTMGRQPLAIGQLISIHQPVYPVEAERAHVEGTVQLRLTIDATGKVEIVHAVGGPPILVPAAIEAVRQWRYAPTTVEGRAMESVDDVSVVFRLANSASSSR